MNNEENMKSTIEGKLTIEGNTKKFRSSEYNYNFDMKTGVFQRWGKTLKDDPQWSPFGNEILDIEISAGTGCPISCKMCYKGNSKGSTPKNMSLETYKLLLSKLPKYDGEYFCCQQAFGITSIGSHPELFDIFQHCRDNKIIPNVTINGSDPLTDDQINKLVKVCGAMAISIVPPNEEVGYKLIRRILDAGGQQINIHYVIHQESIDNAYKVCENIKNNPLLKGLNAIVFLGLKPKNRGKSFDILKMPDYQKLVDYLLTNNIPWGMDSCSAPRASKAIENTNLLNDKQKEKIQECIEKCESGIISAFLDCDGKYWHCSFGSENKDGYGIDVTKVDSFLNDVWLSKPMNEWREKLFTLDRQCPFYSEIHV